MRRIALALLCCWSLVAFASEDTIVAAVKAKINLADAKQTLTRGFVVSSPGTPLVVQKDGLTVGWGGTYRRTTKLLDGQVVSGGGGRNAGRPLRAGETVFLYKIESTPTVLSLTIVTVDGYDLVKPGHGEQRLEFGYDGPLTQVGAQKVLDDVGQWLKTEAEDIAANSTRPARDAESVATAAIAPENCQPDVSIEDRITKKPVQEWQQVLSSSGILSAALLDKDVTFTAVVRRAGDKNFIILSVLKAEENLARAAFESRYRAASGDQLLLGFKKGDPETLVVTQAFNEAKAGGLFGDKLNMSAVWTAELSDADLARLRSAFTARQVDAVRVSSANGQIDLTVPDRNGKGLRGKFICFYQTLDQRGVDLAHPSIPAPVAQAARRATEPAPGEGAISLEQIVEMAAAKLADDVIVSTIKKSGTSFAVTPQALIKLKSAGVSDIVIRALTQ